jgi:hypothetical protein
LCPLHFTASTSETSTSRYTFVAVMADGEVELERSNFGGRGCSGKVHASFV